MGWTTTYGATKANIIRDRTTDRSWARGDNYYVQWKILAHKTLGNNLWKVVQVSVDDIIESTFIALDLLAPSSEGWGYKDITESMGPCEDNCPLEFLSLVPEPTNEWSREWRERVRAYHVEQDARRAHLKTLRVGAVYALKMSTIPHVKIVSTKPLRGAYLNTIYRVPRKMIGEMLPT